jgi:hypothetical protein
MICIAGILAVLNNLVWMLHILRRTSSQRFIFDWTWKDYNSLVYVPEFFIIKVASEFNFCVFSPPSSTKVKNA